MRGIRLRSVPGQHRWSRVGRYSRRHGGPPDRHADAGGSRARDPAAAV